MTERPNDQRSASSQRSSDEADAAIVTDLDRLAALEQRVPSGLASKILSAVEEAHANASQTEDLRTHGHDRAITRSHRRRRSVVITLGSLSGIAAVVVVALMFQQASPTLTPNTNDMATLALNDADDAWLLAEVMDALDVSENDLSSLDQLTADLTAIDKQRAGDGEVTDLFIDEVDGGVL